MGGKHSRDEQIKTVGDQTVTIVENQEVHAAALEQSAWKLNLVLVLLTLQVLLVLIKQALKTMKKTVVKAAAKAAFVQQV